MTLVAARRQSVEGEGGIMWAPKNYSTNSYVATMSNYLFPPFFGYLAYRPWCLPLWQLNRPHNKRIMPQHFTCTFHSYIVRVPMLQKLYLYVYIFTVTHSNLLTNCQQFVTPGFPFLIWPQQTTQQWNHTPKLYIHLSLMCTLKNAYLKSTVCLFSVV